MSECGKVKLWRNALSQFQKTTRYEGVFYHLGYLKYLLQCNIHRDGQLFTSFDIISVNNAGDCLNLELTVNETKDVDKQLTKQSSVTPPEINSQIGLSASSSPVSILVTNHPLETRFCSILIQESASVSNSSAIADSQLRDAVESLNGVTMNAPSVSCQLVPELNKSERRNAVSSVITQVSFLGDSVTVEYIVSMAADEVWDHLSAKYKNDLIKAIRSDLEDLCKQSPSYFSISSNGGKSEFKCKSDSVKNNAHTRQAILTAIDKWVGNKQASLDEYGSQ